jgi:hypothetical protein
MALMIERSADISDKNDTHACSKTDSLLLKSGDRCRKIQRYLERMVDRSEVRGRKECK